MKEIVRANEAPLPTFNFYLLLDTDKTPALESPAHKFS